jgi:deferrochelatase/peroxidase EfeB
VVSGPQAGILNRPTEHLLVASLSFVAADPANPAAARATLEALRTIIEHELHSDLEPLDAQSPRDAVAQETGELGFADGWDRAHLTVTFGLSAAGYDAIGVPEGHADRPVDLVKTPWSQFQDAPGAPDGDLVLHICSDNMHVAEHVLRRVEHALNGRLQTAWVLHGAQRFGSRVGKVAVGEARGLIGFHDGLSNLDPAHDESDAALVFVGRKDAPPFPSTPPAGPQPAPTPGQPGYGGNSVGPNFPEMRPAPNPEPDSLTDGTYMFVRGSVLKIAEWDERALGLQEQTVGRFKPSGAFLDRTDDPHSRDEDPLFATDQTSTIVPRESHARRANPRATVNGVSDADRRIFRRGYPLMIAGAGGLRRGLLFVSFSRTLSTQVEFIMRAWLRNADFPQPQAGFDPLLAMEEAVPSGGYFFVPL